jgi:hypothetical protein
MGVAGAVANSYWVMMYCQFLSMVMGLVPSMDNGKHLLMFQCAPNTRGSAAGLHAAALRGRGRPGADCASPMPRRRQDAPRGGRRLRGHGRICHSLPAGAFSMLGLVVSETDL